MATARQDEKTQKYVEALTEKAEFFGLVGIGYPGSLYKVYVRPSRASKTWWVFEREGQESSRDPIEYQGRLESQDITTVWGPLADIADFKHHPEREGIAMLFERASKLKRRKGVPT